ncbi:MAG: hypothetical protein GPJ51_11215 [Candidatus Heimdallarchaeota archaeon]|nr:hypothetical protein [Candidatus Heimdallarchaeota archaeon]
MSTMQLPQSGKERQEAIEKQLAHYLNRALLIFSEEEVGKKLFLNMLSEVYASHENLAQKHSTKWGVIEEPAKYIKGLKVESWEYEGIKKHYDTLFEKYDSEDLEHLVKLWYVKFELSEIKELVEHYYSEDEEEKEIATEILKGLGVWRLERFLWKEFGRIYKLPPVEYLENYYQYCASTREDNPLEEKHFMAKIEEIQGKLFDCLVYDLIAVEGELGIARMEKMAKLAKDSSTVEEKITILKKLLYLYPYHRNYTRNPIYEENPGYWIYSEVIETLEEIGGEEAEKVLQEIVQGDFHHEETKEEAIKQLENIREIHYLTNLPTLEDFVEKTDT